MSGVIEEWIGCAFVSEMAQVELKNGRVCAPACAAATLAAFFSALTSASSTISTSRRAACHATVKGYKC